MEVLAKSSESVAITGINYKSEIALCPTTMKVYNNYFDVYEKISEVFMVVMIAYLYAFFSNRMKQVSIL